MTTANPRYIDAIAKHADALAADADGHVEREIASCPGWRVRDVVEHLIEVYWFWSTIAGERLTAPPEADRRPGPVDSDSLLDTFRESARTLVETLRNADQSTEVWTWAPDNHTIGFITRHQVQEIAVHHWDVARAVGRPLALDADLASDAVEEFLTVSVSSVTDPADPPRASLNGSFSLHCDDRPDTWTVRDGDEPGTVAVARGSDGATPAIVAPSADLLLWLYGRIPTPTTTVDPALLARFRALTFTT